MAIFSAIFVARKLHLQIACENFWIYRAKSLRFQICAKPDATWRRFWRNHNKSQQKSLPNCTESPLVYTCDRSCIGEGDKNRTCKEDLKFIRRVIRVILLRSRHSFARPSLALIICTWVSQRTCKLEATAPL